MNFEASVDKATSFSESSGMDQSGALEQDKALASQIALGDVDAWDRFFDRYSPWVYRFAYWHLRCNREDAEDLCSDILMTAAQCMKQYDSAKGILDVWLHGVARHRLARFCRGRRIELSLIPDIDHPSSNNDTERISEFAETVHTRDIVNRTLANLPERQANVLIGKYVEGYSMEELARMSETTPKAIESLLVRARSAFRSAFNTLMNDTRRGEKNG
ncbi:MAG: sigma-70 family RNA polymerase sigma factor [Armatimonadota bacterium]|nr:sigma-70 family RNA polymerase sigma factor [Armatimonadota bacterium]